MLKFQHFLEKESANQSPRICIDLSDEFADSIYALYQAYQYRPENILNEQTEHLRNTQIEQLLINTTHDMDYGKLLLIQGNNHQRLLEMALERRKIWTNGQHLKVQFIGGDNTIIQDVINYIKLWETYANIHFDFPSSGQGDIRISFTQDIGSYSYIGTDCKLINSPNPTMNLDINRFTEQWYIKACVLHEFGHALGCIHEHQPPAVAIDWNKPEVYRYYQQQNWPPEKVNRNIFQKYDNQDITNSNYDPTSIMHYPIDQALLLTGTGINWNYELSQIDIDFIQLQYPK
jgi:serralysin